MAVSYAPRSLRFDVGTEERLKILSQLTGESAADLIRRFVDEGLNREAAPENLQKLVDDFASRVAALGPAKETQSPEGSGG